MSNAETTNVVGYYNGNRWPIQLVISRFNITLHLQPGEYILDKTGRKINDSFFEAYAASKQLARETSTTPVAMIKIPLAANSAARAVPDGQSVRAVTEFTQDKHGVRMPIIPPPKEFPNQAVNKSSVIPMSMDEARKAGLVRKVREVPEDFGAPDSDGSPPRKVPTIRYATDAGPEKPVAPLPAAMVESVPQGREALVAQLHQATAAPAEPENAVVFANTITPTAPPNPPIQAGPPGQSVPPVVVVLPAPTLDESESVPVAEPPVEEVREEQPEPPAVSTAPAKDRYVCVACGKGFPFRSQLERHAGQVHKSLLESVMAPYPA